MDAYLIPFCNPILYLLCLYLFCLYFTCINITTRFEVEGFFGTDNSRKSYFLGKMTFFSEIFLEMIAGKL